MSTRRQRRNGFSLNDWCRRVAGANAASWISSGKSMDVVRIANSLFYLPFRQFS